MASSLATSPSSGAAGTEKRPRPAVRYADRARRWVFVPLAIGTFLLAASLQGGIWWQTGVYARSPVSGADHQDVIVIYHVGGDLSCSELNWTYPPTPCTNISERAVTGARGVLYTSLEYVLAALVAVGLVAIALIGLANFGVRRHRIQLTIEIVLALVLTAAAFGYPTVSAAAGPGPQGDTICWYLSGNNSTCPVFWGSASVTYLPGLCGVCLQSVSWGAGDAFYQCLVSGAFFAAAAAVLWLGRNRPFTAEEEAAWAERFRDLTIVPPRSTFVQAPAGPAVPPAGPPAVAPGQLSVPTGSHWVAGRYVTPKEPWVCLQCGTQNLQWANLCRNCGADRP